MRQNRVSSFLGGSENIPRPFAGGSDAGGGDATTRAPDRAKETNPTYNHEHDPVSTPPGGRSRRRRGAFVASSPVAEELGQLERRPNRGNTPNEVPAQKVAGAEDPRTRQDPPRGPSKTRAEPVDKVQRPGREIPDRALRKRANTDVASRARLPGFSPPRGPENAQRRGSANGRSREARAHLCDVKARRRSRGYSRVVTRASRSRKTGALPSTACVEAPLGSV